MPELDGVWECESATINGRKLDESVTASLQLTLNGTQYKTQRGDEVLFDSTYTVDPSQTPPHINMVGIGELAGKIGQGIYELTDDRLTLCYTMPGDDRPQAFESKEGSNAQLMVWRRQ